jgi:hypothetical protein
LRLRIMRHFAATNAVLERIDNLII